jgi:tetratricopeptide (TPR) repeat protein
MIRHPESGVRRLQDEVARDPGSPAFVSLAELYRSQGRLDVARRVCLRGLERHPSHVEAHYLLGRIYRDSEEPEKAYDEWDIALRLDPHNTAARRAIAFLCLERGELEQAERHLRQALENDPDDPRIRRAIGFIESGGRRAAPNGAYFDAVADLLEPPITAFSRESRVRLVLVIDRSGRVITQQGVTRGFDLAAFASLAAAVHAASREIARMLDQPGFSQLYQGKGEHQLFVGSIQSPMGELLLVSVFGEDATVGLVRALFREMTDRLDRTEWPSVGRVDEEHNLEAELAAGLARVGSTPRGNAARR